MSITRAWRAAPPAIVLTSCDADHGNDDLPHLWSPRVRKAATGSTPGDRHDKAHHSRRLVADHDVRPRRQQFGLVRNRRTQDPHRGAEELRPAFLHQDLRLRLQWIWLEAVRRR